jgi:ribonuclease-3
VNTSGGIRQLVGKLFGREGQERQYPFPDTSNLVADANPVLLPDEKLAALEEQIGYTVRDRRYFVQALTHRSYLQVLDDDDIRSNERLEFLGDSILNMVIGEFLFRHYAEVEEGELTKLRSRLVNKKALIIGAGKINLEDFVLVNTSAEQSLQQGNRSIVADAFEAMVAAIYLDSGTSLEPVKHFLSMTILDPGTLEEILHVDENFKSILLELAQAQGFEAPRYEVVDEEGPDHERQFTVHVLVNGSSIGEGNGRSKKKAEQQAARQAIEKLRSQTQE